MNIIKSILLSKIKNEQIFYNNGTYYITARKAVDIIKDILNNVQIMDNKIYSYGISNCKAL